MKRIFALLFVITLIFALASCSKTEFEYYDDSNDIIPNEETPEEIPEETDTNTSPYSRGTFNLNAKNASDDYYHMTFINNHLAYVDLEDGTLLFGYGKGEFEGISILFTGMKDLTVESSIEIFEQNGFTVSIEPEDSNSESLEQ